MFRELNEFSSKYEDSMFNAYTKVWEVGNKLSDYWHSVGYKTANPFHVEDRALPSVELKEALFILAPYWSSAPDTYFKKRDELDYKCIQIAYDVIIDFLFRVNPKSKRVCISTDSSSFGHSFDVSYVYTHDEIISELDTRISYSDDLINALKQCEQNTVWIEASSNILRVLGVLALNHTVYNPYSYEPITGVLFTADREYHEEYEDYLVVSWCSSVRQYTYHICDIRQNVINAHFMDFKHDTDEAFEMEIERRN